MKYLFIALVSFFISCQDKRESNNDLFSLEEIVDTLPNYPQEEYFLAMDLLALKKYYSPIEEEEGLFDESYYLVEKRLGLQPFYKQFEKEKKEQMPLPIREVVWEVSPEYYRVTWYVYIAEKWIYIHGMEYRKGVYF